MTSICMNYAVFRNLQRGAIKTGKRKAFSETYAICSKRGLKQTKLNACIYKIYWKILKHAVIV